jgi:glycosyltransferase involved in cell wall biosynthesis
MKVVAIALMAIPSNAANSIQAMKACQALAELGNEVTLLVSGRSSSANERNLAEYYGLKTNFNVNGIGSKSRRLFTWQAVRRAHALGADLLYVWPLQSAVFGLVHRLPVILEMHDLPSGRVGPLWYHFFMRLAGRKRIAVITHALKQALEGSYGTFLPSRDVILAPNGFDPDQFADLPTPELARRQLALREAPTIACTGHLYAGRGVELFLALARAIPQGHFLWVGGRDKDVETWRTRARRDSLVNVTFTGFIHNEQLPLYQAAADILLMPYGRTIGISSGSGNSAAISSPMKMFEYLAAGRAIVTSDLPVIREVLNESNAIFCPPEDAKAWTQAVTELLDNPARRATLAAQARRDSQSYSWTARARRILDGFLEEQ